MYKNIYTYMVYKYICISCIDTVPGDWREKPTAECLMVQTTVDLLFLTGKKRCFAVEAILWKPLIYTENSVLTGITAH